MLQSLEFTGGQVFFAAVAAANLDWAVMALDAAKAAGARTIGILTEPPTAPLPAVPVDAGSVP
jgi:biopolymer transport protein ExbD